MKSLRRSVLSAGALVAVALALSACEGGGPKPIAGSAGHGVGWGAGLPDRYEPVVATTAATSTPAPRPVTTSAPVRDGMMRQTMAFPTGERSTSALWVEKIYPGQVVAGQPFDYEVRVTNLTDLSLEDVAFVDTIPEGFRVSSAVPQPSATAGGQARWALGTLGPRETKAIKVSGSGVRSGTISTCGSASYSSSLCAAIEVVQPALRLVKSAPAEVQICDPIQVKIEVTNTGSGVARNVKIKDALPAGLTTTDGRSTVDLDVGSLASGQSRSFTVETKATKPGSFSNKVTASAEGGLTAESGTTTTTVRQPVLAIKAECPSNLMIGREIMSKFTVRNAGDSPAVNTVVTANLPAGTQFVRADSSGTSSGGRASWNLGTLKPGESKTVAVTLRSTGAGTLATSATANATCAAQVTDTCSVSIQGVPDIGTQIDDDDGVITVGDTHAFNYEVENQGQVQLTNIKLACTLSDGLEFVSSTAPAQPRVAGKTLEFAVGSLRPGEKRTFTITCKGTTSGEFQIQTETSSAELKRTVRNDEQVTYVDR